MSEDPRPYHPVLSAAQIDALRPHGREHDAAAGEVLFAAGTDRYDFILVLSGRVDVVDDLGGEQERVVSHYGPGEFPGELGVLMGQRAFLSGVMGAAGRVLVLTSPQIDELLFEDVDLSELILRVFLGRHQRLPAAAAGVTLIGARSAPDSRRLIEILARNRVATRWLRPGEDGTAERLLARQGLSEAPQPVVLIPGRPALRDPSERALLDGLGMATPRARAGSDSSCDVLIVGAGPGGLSAAVYAGSEGLDTVIAEEIAFGGQAGTSSRIENYLGFPAGLSGEELAVRALLQMEKFGVRQRLAVTARSLTSADGVHRVSFDDDTCVSARSLIVATGAHYNRLELDRLPDFEGAGVYYAATLPEARACHGEEIVIVGGGNSAGQAAIFLSRGCARVQIAIRGAELAASMSHYLIEQIEATPSIVVTPHTEVTALYGDDHLQAIQLTDTATGDSRREDVGALFVFIGATPCTAWLQGQLATDDRGFLLTGALVPETARDGDRVAMFETSRAGVFCIGDARSGSVKRAAAATGEGATAIRLVYEHLQRQAPGSSGSSG